MSSCLSSLRLIWEGWAFSAGIRVRPPHTMPSAHSGTQAPFSGLGCHPARELALLEARCEHLQHQSFISSEWGRCIRLPRQYAVGSRGRPDPSCLHVQGAGAAGCVLARFCSPAVRSSPGICSDPLCPHASAGWSQ